MVTLTSQKVLGFQWNKPVISSKSLTQWSSKDDDKFKYNDITKNRCFIKSHAEKKTYFKSKYVWVINQWGGWLITDYLFTSRRHINWLGKAGSDVRMTENRVRGGDLLTVMCSVKWGRRNAALGRTGDRTTSEARLLPAELQYSEKQSPVSVWLNKSILKVPSCCSSQKVLAYCVHSKTLEGKLQATVLSCDSIGGIRSQKR